MSIAIVAVPPPQVQPSPARQREAFLLIERHAQLVLARLPHLYHPADDADRAAAEKLAALAGWRLTSMLVEMILDHSEFPAVVASLAAFFRNLEGAMCWYRYTIEREPLGEWCL